MRRGHRPIALVVLALACQGKVDVIPPGTTGVAPGTPSGSPATGTTGSGSTTSCTEVTSYEDADGDRHGNPAVSVTGCTVPSGYVTNADDCDDTEPAAWTGAYDTCDAVDNDCDGSVDEDHRATWVLATVDGAGVFEVDPTTAVTTLRTTIAPGFDAAGVNSTDSRDASLLVLHDATTSQLVSLDSCNGDASVLGPHGQGNMPGIAFGPMGLLYGMDVTNDAIVELDPSTLAGGPVLSLGRDVLNSGMAWDCTNQKIWVADQAAGEIFWYDPATNTTGGFQSSNVPFSGVGLEFDNATGHLFASTGSELWTIDPSTGTGTRVGAFSGGVTSINDLVMLPPCP